MAGPGSSDDPVGMTNIDDVCTDWAQKKYGSKKYGVFHSNRKVVQVDTSGLKVSEVNINYREKERKENQSDRRSQKTFVNRLNIPAEQEFSDQSTKKYTCVWTKTKGKQLSGGLSFKVGLPKAVGLTAKVGGQIRLSETETTTSGTEETLGHVTRLQQPPNSTLLTETITTETVVTMPYSLSFRLQGDIAFTLESDKGKRKVKSEDVVELYREFGGKVVTEAGRKSVLLTTEGNFKATTETSQVVKLKEPDPETTMKMIHNDLLWDNSEKIVEEVKDKPALSSLLEVMSSEQVISEEQSENVSQNTSVQECVNELVDVLQNVEPEKFLQFVNILKMRGYGKLVKLLDPRPIYPDNLKTISNLGEFGVVDNFFVTKKVSEVKSSLKTNRRVIIHGICGSGKTQLMFKVAKDYERGYASVHPGGVVWVIDGISRESITAGVDSLRQSLGGEEDAGLQSLVDQRSHVLLLIDDLSAANLNHIPRELLNSSAKIVVTTQNSTLHLPESKKVMVEGFTQDEAVEFLTEDMSSITLGEDKEDIEELARSFSCLALGLASARRTIQECNMTVKEYKQHLQGSKEAVDELMGMGDEWLQDYHKEGYAEAGKNIFAAIRMASNTLDDQCKSMLQLCAFLMPQNIPILMLKEVLQGERHASFLRFVRDLKRRSLGNIEGEGVKRRLSIHGVTQMVLRLQMDKNQQTATCINRLLQILVKFFLKDTTDSESFKFSVSLMPHVEAALKHADELDQGPEYRLMKARLLMVYGDLLIQKGTPDLSEEYLREAQNLLLQFAGIPLDILSAQSMENDSDDNTISNQLFKALTDKSQSLEDSFIQETVIRRAITKQHLRALSDKLSTEDRATLESMVESFGPLSTEMYMKLVDSKLAIPMEVLKKIFLPELFISIIYTLGRMLSNKEDEQSPGSDSRELQRCAEHMCKEIAKETGFNVLVYFLITTDRSCSTMLMQHSLLGVAAEQVSEHALPSGDDEDDNDNDDECVLGSQLWVAMGLLMHVGMDGMININAPLYELGILTSLGGGAYTILKCFANVLYSCTATMKFDILMAQQMCKDMLELLEREIKAGNSFRGLSAYYITVGHFKGVVGELEKAAEMFWKAYRVELKREEYHPRMEEALSRLIDVRIAQNELRRARVCARRLLQLAMDHWPERVAAAEDNLKEVCCKIVFRALKHNQEEETSNSMNVTTV